MKSPLHFLSVLLLLLPNILCAQSPLDTLVMRAIMVNQLFPQEKVYLHFDNTSYYLGETMWFKAYVVGTADHTLRPQSKVLYVELVAPEGYIVETKKYKLDDKGCCCGEFDLKESILSGYYTVRAYTRYMLNWGDEAIFTRTFPVYDAVSGGHYEIKDMLDRRRSPILAKDKQQAEKKIHLDFYPEGGHLVDGMPCVVAYELLRQDGKPMQNSITIFEDKLPLLCTVPEHNGKGAFHFTPRRGMQYRAEVRYTENNERGRVKEQIVQFALPVVENEGVGIAVCEEADSFILDIRNNIREDIPLGCAILNKGRMQLYEPFSSKMTHKTIILHRDSLPEGVCRLVVFANHDTPLAERQFFVKHHNLHSDDLQNIRLNITTSEDNPIETDTPRLYSQLNLTIVREDGKPLSSDVELSLSVTDKNVCDSIGTGNNLYTHMLLGSELKGYIPDASRYFDEKNANRSRELDLVMLTHGWTSYDWTALSNRHFDLQHPIEEGITIKGELLEFSYSKSKRHQYEKTPISYTPLKFRPMIFSMQKDSVVLEYEFTTDIDGCFRINTEDFYGSRIVSLAPEQKANKQLRPIVIVDKHFSPKSLPEQYLRFSFTDEQQTEILKVGNLDYLLPDLEIVDERRKNRYHLPPISEVRFNYLNEWERNYDAYWEMRKALLDDEMDYNIIEDSILTNKDNGPWYLAPIYCYREPNGDVTIADEGNTPYKVVGSTLLRNFIGCYWLHYVVADEVCMSDSIRMDDKYPTYLDFLNPFNFKEFFISDDYAVRQQITNDLRYWVQKYNTIAKLHTTSFVSPNSRTTYYSPRKGNDYYHGFYVNQILPPIALINDINAYDRFMDRVSVNWIWHANRAKFYTNENLPMETPNYVACMVPYTDAERDSLYIPNGENGWNNRFTHLQGYSQSKRFYAADYSNKELPYGEIGHHRTLLWETEITPDSIGTITVSLNKPLVTKDIRIAIEGMNAQQIFSNEPIGNRCIQQTISTHNDNDLRIWRSIVDTIQPSPTELITMHRDNVEGIRKLHEQQLDDAVTLFKRSAIRLYPPAIANLGICYHRGWGVDKNVEMAYKYYLLAAERGDASACHNLGGCYLNGEAVENNDSLAFVWYQRAAKKEYAQSQVMLGKFYEKGLGPVQQSDSIALSYYLPASEKYPEAAFSAAMILASRDSISQQKEKKLRQSQTIRLIEYAADNNLLAAQKFLADCYRDGHYVKKNKKRMVEYLAACAQQGDEQSSLRLARCYERGIRVRKDEQKAYEYYKRLADKGNAYAMKKVQEYEYYKEFRFDKMKLEEL